MSLLKTEPAGSVKTLEELFAIAAAMEQEAADRYAEIASRMRREGNPSLADVFERMSADEQGHLAGVIHLSEGIEGKAPDPARIRWQLPETFDDEGAGTTDPRLLSAYRALSMAVRNEERAFAFWCYVAAHADAPDIRRAAETMAHEELGHVSTLRRERRKAFHAERSEVASGGDHKGGDHNLATVERRLAELLESLAANASPPERASLQAFAEEARRHAHELEEAPIPGSGAASVDQLPDDPVVLAEMLADRYLETADGLHDEEALGRVQVLAGRAIARLAWLRADLPELQGT